jgi:hypothetical protein
MLKSGGPLVSVVFDCEKDFGEFRDGLFAIPSAL